MSHIEREGREGSSVGVPEKKQEPRVFDKRIRRFGSDETGPKSQLAQLREELNQEGHDDSETIHIPLDYEDRDEEPVEVKHGIPTEFRDEEKQEPISLQTPDRRKKPKTWWNRFKLAIALGTTADNME